jgi:DNA-binding NtrC family response regulator
VEAEDDDSYVAGSRNGFETILVVEDEPALLTLAAISLKRFGYTVLTAGSPHVAIEVAKQYPDTIDVLVTDVVMPGMSGWDVWRQLNETRPNLRCMFMSGYTADVIAHSGVLDEGIHFLQKPFTVHALADKVREVLESDPG